MRFPGARAVNVVPASLVAGILALACSHTVVVQIPPKIDLQPYRTIGIVEFTSNSRGDLGRIATQKFMGCIQNAQPQVRFLELGPEDRLLEKLGRHSLDIEALRAIGEKYGVSSIFTGNIEISNAAPQISIGTELSAIRASAVVNISMVSKHWETVSGATIWTNSRQRQWKVAGFQSNPRDISFNMNQSDEQYVRNLEELAYAVTDNFRPHYERRQARN